MSRDLVVSIVAVVVVGLGIWLGGWLQPRRRATEGSDDSGRSLERRRWWRLWAPGLLPAAAIATLLGWRLQEPPVTDERLTAAVVLFLVPAGGLWLRCAWRALLALRRPRAAPPIATVGLIRPRVVMSPALPAILDGDALRAALGHERAHARHFDPLRIWLAQMVTDLQWPIPFARRRLDDWIAALEIARDEEARLAGAPGEDLAAAVVAVARLHVSSAHPAALLTGAGASLAARVRRLLVPLPAPSSRRARLAPVCLGLAIAVGVLAGVTHGDAFVRALPFVGG